MKSFAWRAYTASGERKSGMSVAEDRADLVRKLRAQGLFPEEITPQGGPVTDGGGLRRPRRLDPDMQAVLVRQLAVLIAAGLPVDEALSAVRSARGTGPVDMVASRSRALVREGAPLSEALAQSGAGLPAYVVSAIRAGEASRDLAAVLDTVAEHLETRRSDRAALATALIYPAFVAAVSLAVCAILMSTVAPELAAMFETTGRPLPPLTAIMLGGFDWLAAHLWLIVGIVAAVVVGVPLALRRPALRDRWHDLLLRLPLAGRLTTQEAASQYLRTLALVIGSRQPVIEAVRNATDVLRLTRHRAESGAVVAAIEAGSPLSVALAQASFIPPVALQLVEAGEKSARVAPMTERAALLVETALVNERKRIATLLDPILMMVIGAFVLAVVLSVLLPIFDLQSALQV